MRTKLAALSAALMLTSTGCSAPPAPVVAPSASCAWVRPIYPPDIERAVLVRQTPVTARAIAEHNAAVEAACPR
mgnify:CR=1 FL=1